MAWLVLLALSQDPRPTTLLSAQEPHREFPAITATEQLPPGAILRLGQFGERTTYNGVYDVAVSPDGKLLAIRPRDHVVRVFDFPSGAFKFELDAHDDRVTALAFSQDSQALLTSAFGDSEKTILWDPRSEEKILEIPGGGQKVCWAESGEQVLIAGQRQLRRVNLDDQSEEILASWNSTEQAVGVSPVGGIASTTRQASRANLIYVEQTGTNGKRSRKEFVGLASPVREVNFAVDGRSFSARYQLSNRLLTWNMDQQNHHTFVEHDDHIMSFAYSPDNRWLVSGDRAGQVILWDLLGQQPIVKLQGHAPGATISCCNFSADGRFLLTGASATDDSSLIVWDLNALVFGATDGEPTLDLTADELAVAWQNLASENPEVAIAEIERLHQARLDSLPLVAQHVAAAAEIVDESFIRGLIDQLDSPNFEIRQQATDKLLAYRGSAEVLLKEKLAADPDAETRFRIRKVLATPGNRPKIEPAEYRQWLRAIHLLQRIGNEQALGILQRLATGHPHQDIAQAAQRTRQLVLLRISQQQPN